MKLTYLLSIIISTFLFVINTNPVLAKELTASGGVRPRPEDLSVTFKSDPPPGSILKSKQVITYTFTYKSALSTKPKMVLSASWHYPSHPITSFNYVINSATSSANLVPVIDLNNHLITWEVDISAPMEDQQSASFQLENDLESAEIADTAVTGTSLVFDYPYTRTNLPFHSYGSTPSPTQADTGSPASPTSPPNPTPSPTVNSITPKIIRLDITEIKDNSASIAIYTDSPTTAKLHYGRSTANLNEIIRSSQIGIYHQIHLTNLSSSSKYYFQIELSNAQNSTKTSDIFILNTAQPDSNISVPDLNTTITTDGLSYDLAPLVNFPLAERFVGVTDDSPLLMKIHIPNSENIQRVIGFFENAQILGFNTFSNPTPREKTELVQETPGVFSNTLLTPTIPGKYRFVLQITDTKGGLLTYYLPFDFHVLSPLTLIDQQTQKPVAGATIQITASEKALYRSYSTNKAGQINLTTLPGKYTINVDKTGYQPLTTPLDISHSTTSLPTIFLTPQKGLLGTLETTISLRSLLFSDQKSFTSDTVGAVNTLITAALAAISLIITFLHLSILKSHLLRIRLLQPLLHQTLLRLINFFSITTIVANLLFFLAHLSTINLISLASLFILITTSLIRFRSDYRHTSL